MDIAKALRDYEADPSDESRLDRIRRELIRTRQLVIGHSYNWKSVVNSYVISDNYIKFGLGRESLFLFNDEPVVFDNPRPPEPGYLFTLDDVSFGPRYWSRWSNVWWGFVTREELNAFEELHNNYEGVSGPEVSLTFDYNGGVWEQIFEQDFKGDFQWVRFLLNRLIELSDTELSEMMPDYRDIFIPKDFEVQYMIAAHNKQEEKMIEEKSREAFQIFQRISQEEE